jgi:hypothetical protein
MTYRPPPARVLASRGGAELLRIAGYHVGDVESGCPGADVVLLDGVLERLSDPVATLAEYSRLLAPDGLLLVQTVEFPEWETHEEMLSRRRPFVLEGLDRAPGRPYLFSRRAVGGLFRGLGFPFCTFVTPLRAAHLCCVVSRQPMPVNGQLANHLADAPLGPLLVALFDLGDRVTALQQSNDSVARQAEVVPDLVDLLAEQATARQQLEKQLAASEADRAARLEVIHHLNALLATAQAERNAQAEAIRSLHVALAASQAQAEALRLVNRLRRLPRKVVRLFQRRKVSA